MYICFLVILRILFQPTNFNRIKKQKLGEANSKKKQTDKTIPINGNKIGCIISQFINSGMLC